MAKKFFNGVDLQNQRLIQVGSPSVGSDGVNKSYVDNLISGLKWKASVEVASTTNINVAAPGTTIDGVTLTNGNRVLLKNQSTASQNGIYQFNGSASALTRTADADAGTLTGNTAVFVSRGTVNADTAWTLTNNDPIAVGTDALVWVHFGGGQLYVEGNGIDITGNTISAVAYTGISVTASGIGIDTAVVPRKYAANIGNGSSTAIAVTHGFGSRDVQVTIMDTATWEEVEADVVHTDNNTVTITFAVAPASSAYRAIVFG